MWITQYFVQTHRAHIMPETWPPQAIGFTHTACTTPQPEGISIDLCVSTAVKPAQHKLFLCIIGLTLIPILLISMSDLTLVLATVK